jgi:Cys-tRNA(Pro)/Cys-tRNA(Cys) deacylase
MTGIAARRRGKVKGIEPGGTKGRSGEREPELRARESLLSKSTRATKALEQAGVAFSVHSYDYDPDADKIGMQAAEALGEAPQRVLKTLIALVDGKPVCVVLRSDREVSMKKLAAALGGKSAEMMKPAEAVRTSGYKIGGVSPFGQTRRLRTAIDADALGEPYVFVNGGQRGLQVRLDPRDAAKLLEAIVALLTA